MDKRVLKRITTFVVIEFIDQLIISFGKCKMFFPQIVMYLLVWAIRKFMIWFHVIHLHPGVINGIIYRSHFSCINNWSRNVIIAVSINYGILCTSSWWCPHRRWGITPNVSKSPIGLLVLDNRLFAFSLLTHFGTCFFVPYRQYLPHVACFHEPLYGFLKTLYY